MNDVLLLALLALGGLVVGSFVNTVIVRVPAKEPLLGLRSRCPQCEAPIARRDNIPVLSWVLLRGRCRSCREPIPVGYPLVEVANAGLWVAAGLRFGAEPELAVYAVLFSVLLALSVIDLELYILPNRITYPSILASLVIVPLLSLLVSDDPGRAIRWALIGGFGYAGFLAITLILYELIVRKEGMGMGDVKLALLLGIWVGWIDPILVLYSLIAASLIGLVVGLGIFIVRRSSKPYPFGPWLAIGALFVILASNQILDSLQTS